MEGSKEDLKIENKKFKYLGCTEESFGNGSYRSRTISSRSWITDIPTRESSEFSTLTGLSDVNEDGHSMVSDELFDSEMDDRRNLLSKNENLTRESNSENQKQEEELSYCSEDTFFDHPSIPSLERSELENYTKKIIKNDVLWKQGVKKFLEKDFPKPCLQKSKVSYYYKIFLLNFMLIL